MSKIIWTGAVSGDPAVAGNWNGGVPTNTDTVIIPPDAAISMAGGTVECVAFLAQATAAKTFGSGAAPVILPSAATITIGGRATYYFKPTLAAAKTMMILDTPSVYFDAASVLDHAGDVLNQSGGAVTTASGIATLNLFGGVHTQSTGAIAAANIYAGAKLVHNSVDAITALNLYGAATVTFAASLPKTVTTFSFIGSGGSLLDPGGVVTFTNPIKLVGCGLGDVTLARPKHYTVALGAI